MLDSMSIYRCSSEDREPILIVIKREGETEIRCRMSLENFALMITGKSEVEIQLECNSARMQSAAERAAPPFG